MKAMIKAAKKLIKEGKVKEVGKRPGSIMYNVDDKVVRIFQKPGRTLITCSCEHHARYCNSPVICKHKLCVLYVLMKNESR